MPDLTINGPLAYAKANRTFRYMDSDCSLDRMIAHYRAMSHREPASRGFWNDRARAIIAAWREQAHAPEQRRAA